MTDATSGQTWAIVLAGGSGTRLSCLTADADGEAVPKQFCSLKACIANPSQTEAI